MNIKRVGIVGCGFMGSGIAQVTALAGFEVVSRDVDQAFVQKGLDGIKTSLGRFAQKGQISQEQMSQTLARITGTTNLADLADCDLIIEAITENVQLKQEVFRELDARCRPETILATNTSSLTVIEIAAATNRPDRVAGLHFFSPVPMMKLVEVVRTIASSDGTIATLRQFGEAVGKTVVIAQDIPGFIVNRLLVPYLLDAIRFYESGGASREDIDEAMKLGCGYPMGPLTLSDFVGLDITCAVAESLYSEFREPRFAPPVLLKRLVLAGHLGRKAGKGFYDYSKA